MISMNDNMYIYIYIYTHIPCPRREVYLLDLPSSSGTADSRAATRPDLVVKRLDCGTAQGRLPHGHPSMNGAASDFDPMSDLETLRG